MRNAARIHAVAGCTRAGLIAVGGFVLVTGLLVYLTDRDASRTLLIPTVSLFAGTGIFGCVGPWLPSFAHPFAFSLFSAALAAPGARPAYWACAMWWAIDVAFEVAQVPVLGTAATEALRHGLGPTWISNALSNYLLRGTFDTADILAATAGALAAAAVLRLTTHREQRCAIT